MQYKNFYENAKEANLRLRGTVIWYDGPGEQGPYHVFGICDHSSGILKIYMKKLGQKLYPPDLMKYPPTEEYGNSQCEHLGNAMDEYMKAFPNMNMVRKDLSSPHFKAFRPFPLGMMNSVKADKTGKPVLCETLFLERQPQRITQQGLLKNMIFITPVSSAVNNKGQPAVALDLFSEDFHECVMGKYPSIETCVSKLTDPNIANEAVAFHRNFAIVRGPIGMLFLSYKADIVGILDNRNLSSVTVDREFGYTKEAISDLKVFNKIQS